ncbi:uncharacterized protein METZ01_LOCUS102690, partial [marine metagenome]
TRFNRHNRQPQDSDLQVSAPDQAERLATGNDLLRMRPCGQSAEHFSGWANGAAASAAVLHTVGRGFESLFAHHP